MGENNPMYGLKRPEHSERMSGEGNPFYGKKHTEETNRKHAEAKKGKPLSEEASRNLSEYNINVGRWVGENNYWYGKTGELSPMYGKHHTKETKRKISEANSGENSSNWLGGISFEPYGLEFNEALKKEIRERDNYICQVCGKLNSKHVHHIDYNKKNNDSTNLIILCGSCHNKTNFNRMNYEIGFYFLRAFGEYTLKEVKNEE